MKIIFILFIAGIFLLTYCTKEDSAPTGANQDSDPIISGDLTIGPAGGTIGLTDGSVVFEFPPNAVSSQITITIEKISDPLNDPWVLDGSTYKFGPEGIQFSQPVKLKMKLTSSSLPLGCPDSSASVYKLKDTIWQVSESVYDYANKNVITEINGFSMYTLRVVAPSMLLTIGKNDTLEAIEAYGNVITKSCINYDCNYLTDTEKYQFSYAIPPFTEIPGNTIQNIPCDLTIGTDIFHGSWVTHGFFGLWKDFEFETGENHKVISKCWLGNSFDSLSYFDLNNIKFNVFVSCKAAIPYAPPGYVNSTNVEAYLSLGYLYPPSKEWRRINIIIINPKKVTFNLNISYNFHGEMQWTSNSGLPTATDNATGFFEYLLLGCNEDYEVGTTKNLFDFSIYGYDPVKSFISAVIEKNLSDFSYQLWLGGAINVVASSAHNNDQNTIGYGNTKTTDIQTSGYLLIETIPATN